jgi:hypothetical protein
MGVGIRVVGVYSATEDVGIVDLNNIYVLYYSKGLPDLALQPSIQPNSSMIVPTSRSLHQSHVICPGEARPSTAGVQIPYSLGSPCRQTASPEGTII